MLRSSCVFNLLIGVGGDVWGLFFTFSPHSRPLGGFEVLIIFSSISGGC